VGDRGSGSGPITVAEVMTHRVIAVYEGASLSEVVGALTRHRIGALPVIDTASHVIGMVSESDLLAHMVIRAAGVSATTPLADRWRSDLAASELIAGHLMSAPAITVRAEVPVSEAAVIAARAGLRRLPVVDADRVLVGIVSRADLLKPYLLADSEPSPAASG
jgi:CBS-domain-containing membrane protein